MLVESRRIMPITKLQKELTQTVRELAETGEVVYILKNNKMEAVMVPFEEYEYLMNLEEMFEYFEINEVVSKRVSNYNPTSNIAWSGVKED
ncbi:MAG: type II toxin-antitoxin system Phd/YefM family antitoxin [Spirochaetales bacterium]|nr:type II toxin-antitoxin system Phd/YefM family antitoxin [Spirochaetales bacterium]